MAEFLAIRHSYDDHSYIDGNNDTSLTDNGVVMAREMSLSLLDSVKDRKIILRYSSKKRAVETAEILCDSLDKSGIEYEARLDKNLTELYQGNFMNLESLTHEEKIELLQSCWEEFDEHRLKNNLDYCFGDYNNALNGKIDNRFTMYPFGESQREFSVRIGNAVLSMCGDLQRSLYPIGITHRGAIREIKNLLRSVNEGVPMEQVKDFEIYGMRYCEIVKCNIDDIDIAEKSLAQYLESRNIDANNN